MGTGVVQGCRERRTDPGVLEVGKVCVISFAQFGRSSTSWPLPTFPPLSHVTLALGLCSNHVELLSVDSKAPTHSLASGA